jgi:hypothetical protein
MASDYNYIAFNQIINATTCPITTLGANTIVVGYNGTSWLNPPASS